MPRSAIVLTPPPAAQRGAQNLFPTRRPIG